MPPCKSHDFRAVARWPYGVILALVLQYVVCPLLALVVVRLLPMPPGIAVGLFLAAALPSGIVVEYLHLPGSRQSGSFDHRHHRFHIHLPGGHAIDSARFGSYLLAGRFSDADQQDPDGHHQLPAGAARRGHDRRQPLAQNPAQA